MAINPPPEPEPDAPQWVKDLFTRLADKVEAIEQKVSNNNVQAPQSPEGQSGTAENTATGNNGDDSGDTERKPKRRRSWIFRD